MTAWARSLLPAQVYYSSGKTGLSGGTGPRTTLRTPGPGTHTTTSGYVGGCCTGRVVPGQGSAGWCTEWCVHRAGYSRVVPGPLLHPWVHLLLTPGYPALGAAGSVRPAPTGTGLPAPWLLHRDPPSSPSWLPLGHLWDTSGHLWGHPGKPGIGLKSDKSDKSAVLRLFALSGQNRLLRRLPGPGSPGEAQEAQNTRKSEQK